MINAKTQILAIDCFTATCFYSYMDINMTDFSVQNKQIYRDSDLLRAIICLLKPLFCFLSFPFFSLSHRKLMLKKWKVVAWIKSCFSTHIYYI